MATKKKNKYHVDVTCRDGVIERHSFKTHPEMIAFIRGLSTECWRSYSFDDIFEVK